MYEIEFAGKYHEAMTLNAALDWAKQLVAEEPYQLDGCTVEHDELTNTWYVQGVAGGHQIGAAVVISGPDAGAPQADTTAGSPGLVSPPPSMNRAAYVDVEFDGWARRVVISGTTSAEAFGKVAGWLAHLQSPVHITAVRSINRRSSRYFALEIYFDEVLP